MKTFKEFQFGWWILIVLVPIMVGMNFGLFNDPARSIEGYHSVFNITCLIILLLFYSMTTRVEGDKVIVSFGIGLIHKTIKVDHLRNIDLVQNPFIYGWGIRMIPNGWLYNITGSDAIELQFSDRENIVRIASKDAALLRKEILLQVRMLSQNVMLSQK